MAITLSSLVAGIPRGMGSYGPIVQELEGILDDPRSNLLDMGRVMARDPDLTARLLRLGNSSFYGFPTRLETVTEAVSLIGLQQVRDLLVATHTIETFAGVSSELITMQSFWRHSLACGIGARVLALAKRIPKPDKFFVAGLLHDVGRLALYSQAPVEAREVFRLHRSRRMLLRQAEQAVLGFDHADIGQALLKEWQYPPNLVEAVGCHHRRNASGLFLVESALVHVADHLVNAMQLGTSGERFAPPLLQEAWARLQLSPDIIESVVRAIDEHLEAIEDVFIAVARKGAWS